VLSTYALRLDESSNVAVGNVGNFARIIRVGIRDAKAHAHVDNEAILLIDKYVFERKIAMANATFLKVIKTLRAQVAMNERVVTFRCKKKDEMKTKQNS
jgi:hypothetical protein